MSAKGADGQALHAVPEVATERQTIAQAVRDAMLEEMGQDYARTAAAKGLGPRRILFKHILKNAMIPILTGVVVPIPFLFIGSPVLESFFAIPGMGSFTLEASSSVTAMR